MITNKPKSGKTTISTKFDKHLLLAFEAGYKAIPGAMALPMNSWSDFKKALRQLKQPQVQEAYSTIILDTVDIAYDLCVKHICNINGVDSIGAIPYGGGHNLVAKEFDESIRLITQLGYGLVMISHSTNKQFVNEDGQEYSKIVPTLANKGRLICERACDIIGYSTVIETPEGMKTRLYTRGTTKFTAGSRFAYMPPFIDFNYDSLVNAIADAIDKEALEHDNKYVKNERDIIDTSALTVDYDVVMEQFNTLVQQYMNENPEYYGARIVEVVERHLGKGKKVAECTRDQADIIDLIIYDLKELKK